MPWAVRSVWVVENILTQMGAYTSNFQRQSGCFAAGPKTWWTRIARIDFQTQLLHCQQVGLRVNYCNPSNPSRFFFRFLGGQKINANIFCTKFFNNPSGHGRPCRKSWTSAPKSAFSCGPGGGEKLFDPWAFGRKGQECPREIRAKKFMFMLFFFR